MSEEIRKAQLSLGAKVEQIRKRMERAKERKARLETALAEATQETTTTEEEFNTLSHQYQEFVKLFPLSLTESEPSEQPVRRAAKSAERRPTMIDSMRLVMGNRVMSAPDIEKALRERGLDRPSNNLRGYISTLLSSHDEDVLDADGKRVMVDGKPTKFKTFVCVSRGFYRVAPTPGTDEDVLESTTTAEDLLASQGVDVASLTAS